MKRILLATIAAVTVAAAAAPAEADTVDFSFASGIVTGQIVLPTDNGTNIQATSVIIDTVSVSGTDPFNFLPNFGFPRPFDTLTVPAITNQFTVVNGSITAYDFVSGIFDNQNNDGGFQLTLAVNDTTLTQYDSSQGEITDAGINLTTVSATPLPAALPLFASGLGVVGFMARRRRKRAA